jgi:hypothetical protein
MALRADGRLYEFAGLRVAIFRLVDSQPLPCCRELRRKSDPCFPKVAQAGSQKSLDSPVRGGSIREWC